MAKLDGATVILVLDECVAAYEESATRWQSHTKQTECGAEFYSHMGGGQCEEHAA